MRGCRGDAAEAAPIADAGTFLCGDTLCGPSEICLTLENDCIEWIPGDSGTCPDGWVLSDAGDRPACFPAPPTPSCVDPASMPLGTLDCYDPDGGGICEVNVPPLPSGCSRNCHTFCI